ncbi:metallophosphoesterase [Luteolibacter sp. GHJ8]|uniref:Metallophosphoesterase n=1 Tax=Luteolibacter rhizosphaerae TaxID=2989719 RepID=A0ABT3G596_9BACT|nr:metallophosphoesterase [Luteolibacter rhizosphaerae]MCW1915036.1 metallophosphoesterase [Luteolibacter rhizosphaerae]
MNRRRFLTSTAIAGGLPGIVKAEEGAPPLLRFGLITDAQYADAEAKGERHYRSTPEKLKRAVEELHGKDLAFTLHLGDFIDRDFKSFDVMLPLMKGLGHPVYHLLGNHDYDVADGEKGRVVSTLEMPHDYYSFRSRGIRFIMTDTNEVSVYRNAAASVETARAKEILAGLEAAGAAGAKPWNGGFSATQMAWLERELAAADAAKERVIVCGHHPLAPADMHQMWNHVEVMALLEKHPCVMAWFNGHNHAGDFAEKNGIPYVTFRSMLHHPENTAYSIVEVHADRVKIEGFGREVSRELRLRVA